MTMTSKSSKANIGFKETSAGVNRAKQFMPFMALKGYFDLCREKERQPEPRHELTEEEALALSQVIAQLRKGDLARVVFYDKDAYVPCEGVVTEVVPELGFIRIVRREIPFSDVLSISKL